MTWCVRWLCRSAPSGRPSSRRFGSRIDAEAFLDFVRAVYGDAELELVELIEEVAP